MNSKVYIDMGSDDLKILITHLDGIRNEAKSKRSLYKITLCSFSEKVKKDFNSDDLIDKDYFLVNPQYWGIENSLKLRKTGRDKHLMRMLENKNSSEYQLSDYFHLSLILSEDKVLNAFGDDYKVQSLKQNNEIFKDFFVPDSLYLMMIRYSGASEGAKFIYDDVGVDLYNNVSEFVLVRL